MSFKKKIRVAATQKENNKKRIPLWAKISIPSSLVAIGAVFAIVIANSLGTGNNSGIKQVNSPYKIFNSEHNELNPSYVQSIKDFAIDYLNLSHRFFYDSKENSQRDEENGNIVFSPVAITNQLYMLYDATSNAVKDKILQVLHHSQSFDYLEENRKVILNNAIDNNRCFSEISTGLFLRPWLEKYLNQQYVDLLTEYYFADIFVESDDWREAQKQSCEYYQSKSMSHLGLQNVDNQNIDDCDDSETILTPLSNEINLTPCVHFESFWNVHFSRIISSMVFRNLNGTINEQVSQIRTNYVGNILETNEYFLLKLPLDKHSFNILLPKGKEANQPSAFLGSLLSFAYDSVYTANISLSLPTFNFENFEAFDLLLANLGIGYNIELDMAFSSTDERKKNLRPELSLHSSIDVSDAGLLTYSTSFSAYVTEPCSTTENDYPSVEIAFNQPFLFSITDSSEFPLFVGQVCHF